MNPLTLLNSLPGALAQGLIWGIMAIGVAITYKILDYADLTVDNSLCTGGAVAAVCIIGGMNPLLALLCAVLAGALAGLCTGLLHTVLGIPAILSGILTQLALYSINMHIMGGKSNLTVSRTQYQLLLSSAKVPAAILVSGIFVIAIVALLYWFFGTQLGCAIRATGNNEHMARAMCSLLPVARMAQPSWVPKNQYSNATMAMTKMPLTKMAAGTLALESSSWYWVRLTVRLLLPPMMCILME